MNTKEWVEEEESEGFSDEEVSERLLEAGYTPTQVSMLIHKVPIGSLSPTLPKIIMSSLVILVLLFSFYVNTQYIPPVSDFICQRLEEAGQDAEVLNDIEDLKSTYNADPKEIISLAKKSDDTLNRWNQEQADYYVETELLMLGNMYPYPLYGNLIMAPCEANGMDDQGFCRYYMTQETYNCLKEQMHRKRISTLFYTDMPPYKPMGLGWHIVSVLSATFATYILMSVLGYLNHKVVPLKRAFKVAIGLAGFLVVLLLDGIVPWFITLIPLLIWVLISFVKNPKYRKKIIMVLTIIIIVGTVLGFAVAHWILLEEGSFLGAKYPKSIDHIYEVVQCAVTMNLTVQQAADRGFETNRSWTICEDCNKLCESTCPSDSRPFATDVAGDNPSCICRC